MEKSSADYLKKWFQAYVESYRSDDPEYQRNFDLKKKHTHRVCGLIKEIGRDLGLNEEEQRFSEIIALFHDIGRFEQYARYNTFLDSLSLNHAEFGVKILLEQGALDALDASARGQILEAILNHNRAALPRHADEASLFFSRLLRDADKLDIWRVVTRYYQRKAGGEHNHAIELDLPNTPGVSEAVCRDLVLKKMVDIRSMRNLNDFKLLQVGWVYDVNFVPTFQRLRQKGYLSVIRKALPDSGELREIFAAVEAHVDEKLQKTP
jgi:hypothetical protein